MKASCIIAVMHIQMQIHPPSTDTWNWLCSLTFYDYYLFLDSILTVAHDEDTCNCTDITNQPHIVPLIFPTWWIFHEFLCDTCFDMTIFTRRYTHFSQPSSIQKTNINDVLCILYYGPMFWRQKVFPPSRPKWIISAELLQVVDV